MCNISGRTAISNCRAPTVKLSVILDFHLTPVMQNGKLYIKVPSDSINKIRRILLTSQGSFLETADVSGFCIPLFLMKQDQKYKQKPQKNGK